MATISEINQFQSVRGDTSAGGGSSGAILIDSSPLNDLARYTMIANKFKYEENEKKAQDAAKQIADLTAYDLTVIPEESNEIRKEWDNLVQFARNDPSVMDFSKNQQGYIDYYKKKNEFVNKLSGGKKRLSVYSIRQSEIERETNLAEKARKQKELDADIKRTGLNQPLPATQQYDIEPVAVKPVGTMQFDVAIEGPNKDAINSYTVPDVAAARGQSNAAAFGLLQDAKAPTTPQELSQYEARLANKRLEPVETAKELSLAISQLPKDANGKPDFSKAPNILKKAVEEINSLNQYLLGMKQDIKTGKFKDKLGVIKFGDNRGLSESDYDPINIEDGISPDELLFVKTMAISPKIKEETKLMQTDNAIQIRGQNLDAEAQRAALKQRDKEWKATQKGSETQVNGAMVFADRIFGELKSLADANGVITPDNLRKLNVEQLKYLGIEEPETVDANGIKIKGGFKPLDIKGADKDNRYGIQLTEDGRVNVFSKAKVLPDGRIEGMLDPKKSTTKFNIATNRLNEELKTAGAKELNTYWGVDVTGAPTSNTSGTTSTSSGSSTSGAASTGTAPKTISRSALATKAAESGYTTAEYEKALKEKGIKITD